MSDNKGCKVPPAPDSETGLAALRELFGPYNLIGALSAMHRHLGYIFRLSLPGFSPIFLSGPDATHFALVEERARLHWRNEADPVTSLLRHGLLVEDGEAHDSLRRKVMPALHRQQVSAYIDKMWHRTNQVIDAWEPGDTYDMLVEMRRLALLIVMDTLFDVDMTPDLDLLFPAILDMLKFISPGLWLLGAPRRQYGASIAALNNYLYRLIRDRRAHPSKGGDLLSQLIAGGMDDDLIRDQMLTLLIAGHDTSTALLAWSLYLVGRYPQVRPYLEKEIANFSQETPPTPEQIESLVYCKQVIDETLRLYPPIHVGNRLSAEDLSFCGYDIPKGSRVMVSIYATHHDDAQWPKPERFDPDRFAPGNLHVPYSYLPFGGGPRNCIGANFAQVEARVILARLFQRYELTLTRQRVHVHMGATLEPRPGVLMQVSQR
ncbi:MAG: cytochrome P450 [Anaerolineales bacterium]